MGGKYEIDKRPVTLSMASTGVLVSEDQCATVGKPVPLKQYLHQASNVAKEMKDSPAKIDQRVRVTFDMDTTPDETDRREAMRIACKQAGIRTTIRASQTNEHVSPRRVRIRLKKSGSPASSSM